MAIVFVSAKIFGGQNGYVPTYGDGHQGTQLGKMKNDDPVRIPVLSTIPTADVKKWYSFKNDKPWYVRLDAVPETWVELSHVQVVVPPPVPSNKTRYRFSNITILNGVVECDIEKL